MRWRWRYIWWAVIISVSFAAFNELYGFVLAGDPIDWALIRALFVVLLIEGAVVAIKHPGKVGKTSKKSFGVLLGTVSAVGSGLAWLAARVCTAARHRMVKEEVGDELQ